MITSAPDVGMVPAEIAGRVPRGLDPRAVRPHETPTFGAPLSSEIAALLLRSLAATEAAVLDTEALVAVGSDRTPLRLIRARTDLTLHDAAIRRMHARGLSDRAIARRLDVCQASLSRYMRAHGLPPNNSMGGARARRPAATEVTHG